MTEIVVDKITINILHIEIHISFGHRMVLRDMSYNMDVLCYCAGLIYQDKSIIVNLWPLCSNTMEISSLRKELTTHCNGRKNNSCFVIDAHKVPKSSCMVAVAMRDKYIVHRAEIYSQAFRIMDEHITGSRVQQDTMLLCLKKNRQAMLRLEQVIIRAIV